MAALFTFPLPAQGHINPALPLALFPQHSEENAAAIHCSGAAEATAKVSHKSRKK